MKHFLISLLFLFITQAAIAQYTVNVELKTTAAEFGDDTEASLKDKKGELWIKAWEEQIKPRILADICDQYNLYCINKRLDISFGHHEDAQARLIVELQSMDQDGECDMQITLSERNDFGTYDVIWQEDFDKKGEDTHHYNNISSIPFVKAAFSSSSRIVKALGFKTAHKMAY